jgi:murein DD-endopeptidase MepM/ murein hydrolase activator NlpD
VPLVVALIGALAVLWSDPALCSRRATSVRSVAAKSKTKPHGAAQKRSGVRSARVRRVGATAGHVRASRTSSSLRALGSRAPGAGEESWEARRRPLSLISPVDLIEFGNQSRAEERPNLIERHAMIRRGDSFARILRMYDVSPARALAFERAARQVFDLARIRPRRSISLLFDRTSDELVGVEYSIDDTIVLVVEAGFDGTLHARLARTPSSVEIRGVSGTIGESTASDCGEAGVPDRIVNEIADLFAWDVDFEGLSPGDRFRAVYEVAVGEHGEAVQMGAILAAEIESQGRVVTAIYHADDDGVGAYFDPEGRSLERGQLRYPLEFTRVSSEFSESRFHPILRRSRPHRGVDFAAPKGTPVRAVADGVVSTAGWDSGLGLAVRIAHGPAGFPYDSLYGHLSRIARLKVPGRVVRKGEIIGYVGSTGLATGPHLHFALHAGEDYVDPLRLTPPPRFEARVPLGAGFERSRGVLLAALDSLQRDGPVHLTRISGEAGTAPLLMTY